MEKPVDLEEDCKISEMKKKYHEANPISDEQMHYVFTFKDIKIDSDLDKMLSEVTDKAENPEIIVTLKKKKN